MKILLSNDDSYDSPLFHILYDCLNKLGHQLTCVMPATEQSWKAKAMSRSGNLRCRKLNIDGRSFFTFEGTPADCINFGLYHICEEKPDVIFSGINLGYNVSLAYILSSGTFGACMEGRLAGIPGIAFSQQLDPETFQAWSANRSFPEEKSAHFSEQFEKIMLQLTQKLELLVDSDEVWSVEIPALLKENWKIIETQPSTSFYGCTFKQNDDGSYTHGSPRLSEDLNANSDLNVMLNGNVALNRINLQNLAVR